MLRSPSWCPLVILFLTVVVCLPTICSAATQDDDLLYQLPASPLDELYLAQQPGGAGAAVPPAAAPLAGAPAPAAPGAAAPQPTPPSPSPFDMESMLASRSPLVRFASMPNMFGDSMGLRTSVVDFGWWSSPPSGPSESIPSWPSDSESMSGGIDIPPAGASRNVKIAENNKALPMDRVYFMYNHFQNALTTGGPYGRAFSVDRYTIGAEKTFRDGLWSAELRMPFGGGYSYFSPDLGVEGTDVGNLSITLKRLLYTSNYGVVAGGLGIGTPTGGDVTGHAIFSDFALYNDAVHLSPWVGFLRSPNDRFFYQGFLQVDVATNGNRVEFGGQRIGNLYDQTLMLADLELGYWLYRNPRAPFLRGLAGIFELHYTTTLQDANFVSGFDGNQFLTFGNLYNRVDLMNLTVGLHAEMGLTTLSVGAVFPLRDEWDRAFDAEVQVFLNRRF